MKIGYVDYSSATDEHDERSRFPSPALLKAAAQRAAQGDEVYYLQPGALTSAGDRVDRIVAAVPPWCVEQGNALIESCAVDVQLLDPWNPGTSSGAAPDEDSDEHPDGPVIPRYDLVQCACHGETDLAPRDAPVHPWVVGSAVIGDDAAAESRLRAAAAGLSGLHSTSIVLGDERVRLTTDRMRLMAELVSAGIKNRQSLIEFSLRVWPEDLLSGASPGRSDSPADPGSMVDHLSLLPIQSLDLLVGSFHPPSLERMNTTLTTEDLASLAVALSNAGLAHVTRLSIVAGLPGESIRDSVASLDAAMIMLGNHQFADIRCSLWIGPGGPPRSPDEQKQRFLESHPDWSEEEYRGIHDLFAVIRQASPDLSLIGPGFASAWDSVP